MSSLQLQQDQIQRIGRFGFKNQLYQALKLPVYCIPRTLQFNLLNATFMGLALSGYIIGKKYGLLRLPFSLALAGVPILSLVQRRQLDSFTKSPQSRKQFRAQLQNYPLLMQAYDIVQNQGNQHIRSLQNKLAQLKLAVQAKTKAKII